MWTKRSDHAPKSVRVHFPNICPKRAILRFFFFVFDLLPFFVPSFHVTMKKFATPPNKKNKRKEKKTLLWHGPLTYATREHLLPLPLQSPLDYDSG